MIRNQIFILFRDSVNALRDVYYLECFIEWYPINIPTYIPASRLYQPVSSQVLCEIFIFLIETFQKNVRAKTFTDTVCFNVNTSNVRRTYIPLPCKNKNKLHLH